MIYKSLEDVRCRSNKIALVLNEATHYGRRPLPKEFADLERECRELNKIYQHPTEYPALFKGGVEVVEADTALPPHEYDALTVAYCNPWAILKDGLKVVETTKED